MELKLPANVDVTLPSGMCVPIQKNAIHADGQRFQHTQSEPLIHRLQSMSSTGVVAGASRTMQLNQAAEKATLMARAQDMGGVPIILAIMVSVRQSITLPAVGTSTKSVKTDIYERRAYDTIVFTGGSTGQFYYQGKPLNVGRFQYIADEFIAPSICEVALCVHPDAEIDTDRIAAGAADGTVYASDDSNPRSRLPYGPKKFVRTISSIAGTITPEYGTERGDVIVFPVVADGRNGWIDAGMMAQDFFSSDSPFVLTYTPQNNTNLYRTAVGEAPAFGNFDLEVSVLFRVHVIDPKRAGYGGVPRLSDVWWLNDYVTPFSAASGNRLVLDAAAIRYQKFLGFLPRFHDATVDGGSGYCLNADTNGAGTDYLPQMTLIPPVLDPANMLNKQSTYLIINEGQVQAWPNGNDTLTYGGDFLGVWNSQFRNHAAKSVFEAPVPMGHELPNMSSASIATAATTLASPLPNGGVGYNVAVGPFAPVTSIRLGTPGDKSTAGGSDTLYARLGGLMFYPLGWTGVRTNGFPGYGVRGDGDDRPYVLIPNNGWTPPTFVRGGQTQAWPVSEIVLCGTYTDNVINGGSCHSDDHDGVAAKEGPKAAVARSFSASMTMPEAVFRGYLEGRTALSMKGSL